jgi:hypothetical protein
VLATLQDIIDEERKVSPALLPIWLHKCGPPLLSVREHYRVFSFLRVSLSVPLESLQQWCRLPAVKVAGYEIVDS